MKQEEAKQEKKEQSIVCDQAKCTDRTQIQRKKKIAIVGCSESKTLAPYKDTSWEFWGVNNLFLTMPDKPWTRWFEIHEIAWDGMNFKRRGSLDFRGQNVNKYLDGIASLKCPVYMQKQWPCIKNAIKYPYNEIVQMFKIKPSDQKAYFTNTISWQIALAISEGAEEIGIWGVDMAVDTEYHHQRPSCEFFIGYALGKGIKIKIPDEADLCKARFHYGFEEMKSLAYDKKMKNIMGSLNQRMINAGNQSAAFHDQQQQYIGAIQGMKEALKNWDECK